jgi:iron-sulfur cluster assembly protein
MVLDLYGKVKYFDESRILPRLRSYQALFASRIKPANSSGSSDHPMITVTASAVKHLHDLLNEKDNDANTGLRLMVEKGGCAGWQYTMKMDKAKPEDQIYAQDGVQIIVDQASLSFLTDSCIDYVDSLSDTGFKVINPNAARSCGCGSSFEPKED